MSHVEHVEHVEKDTLRTPTPTHNSNFFDHGKCYNTHKRDERGKGRNGASEVFHCISHGLEAFLELELERGVGELYETMILLINDRGRKICGRLVRGGIRRMSHGQLFICFPMSHAG